MAQDNPPGRKILTTFFKYTRIAANALYGDFKFKPYYNLGFHLDALTSFLCHIARFLHDFACAALCVAVTPLYVLNPLAWLWLPGHAMDILDDTVGALISAVTVFIHPVVFAIRTLTSMVFGYDENNDNYEVEDEENSDWELATTIGAFSKWF